MKRKTVIISFCLLTYLAMPYFVYPKFISARPTEYPTLNKIEKIQSDLRSSNMDFTRLLTAIELEELLKCGGSETIRAVWVMSSPFRDLSVRIHDWLLKHFTKDSPQEIKL